MDVHVLDQNFEDVYIIDNYISLIWTDRYSSYGDFELVVPASVDNVAILATDRYLWIAESKHLMIIESIEISSDLEYGSELIVTGRSLESILDRRIIWKQTNLKGKVQDGIKKLLDENAISPEDADRKIPNLVFKASTDPLVVDNELEAQFTGDNLFEAIAAICDTFSLGFKMEVDFSTKNINFGLYSGVDRSYDQDANPYVIFSPNFENLINSNYLESQKEVKTVALVAGEGEGTDRKTATVYLEDDDTKKGLARRELFVDARDISSTTGDEVISEEEYYNQLAERGIEQMSQYSMDISFEGEIDYARTFKYGTDYYLGDLVQLENEWGIQQVCRVTELIISNDESGTTYVPTFSIYS